MTSAMDLRIEPGIMGSAWSAASTHPGMDSMLRFPFHRVRMSLHPILALSLALASPSAVIARVEDPPPTQRPDQPTRPPLAKPLAPVAYKSFQGKARSLFPWKGEKIAFLTPTSDLDPVTMTRLVEVFDRMWRFYADATDREPAKSREYEGCLSIAVEPETCGAGCGYLGFTGIELMPDTFRALYDGVRRDGKIDQALPYELGRNFWFYGDALEYVGDDNTGSITTGYAVLMRFWAIEAAGCEVGPFRDASGKEFLAEVRGLVDLYTASMPLSRSS